MLETIVASVIFLVIFAISLETITRLTSSPRGVEALIEADFRLKECFGEYSSPKYTDGDYERTYDWGNIHIDVSAYMHYRQLRHISLTTVVAGSRKVIKFNHIVAIEDE